MKHIKKLNIDFNNWDEADDVTDINKFLLSVFKLLKINNRVLVNFNKHNHEYSKEWGTIKYKNNNALCIEFDNNINGHNGLFGGCRGKDRHCWYFRNNNNINKNFNLFIIKIKK